MSSYKMMEYEFGREKDEVYAGSRVQVDPIRGYTDLLDRSAATTTS